MAVAVRFGIGLAGLGSFGIFGGRTVRLGGTAIELRFNVGLLLGRPGVQYLPELVRSKAQRLSGIQAPAEGLIVQYGGGEAVGGQGAVHPAQRLSCFIVRAVQRQRAGEQVEGFAAGAHSQICCGGGEGTVLGAEFQRDRSRFPGGGEELAGGDLHGEAVGRGVSDGQRGAGAQFHGAVSGLKGELGVLLRSQHVPVPQGGVRTQRGGDAVACQIGGAGHSAHHSGLGGIFFVKPALLAAHGQHAGEDDEHDHRAHGDVCNSFFSFILIHHRRALEFCIKY